MTQTSPTPTIETVMPDPDAAGAERRKLALLGGIFVSGIVLSLTTHTFPVVAFCMAMAAVVMLHEAAHFAVAKLSGMKATEFFFGFGPRLWSIRKGETEYGIKALPFGGYVKIVGMSNLERDIAPEDEPRTYRQGSYPKRMAVALAGIATHFLLAFLLLVVLLSAVGVPGKPTLQIGTISRLDTGASPAVDAGLQVGDRIVSVDGTAINTWDELLPHIRSSAGQTLTVVVERDGATRELKVTPTSLQSGGETRGFIGIGPKLAVERMNPVAGSGQAVVDIWKLSTGSFRALGAFFAPGSLANYADDLTSAHSGAKAKANADDQRFISVVGVARIAGQAADSGAFNLIYLLALLNIFIGVFNVIPLLPLDGGHVAIATYERLRSRAGRRYHADVGKMMPVAAAVIAVLVLIGITSIYLDIVQPMANPFQ